MLFDPIEDLLTSYGLYPFEWINECPYTIDYYGLYFELYGSKPLIRVRPLHGIHIGDQILIFLIEFNRITSQNLKSKYLSDGCGTLSDLLDGAFTMGSGFDLINSVL